MMAAINSKFTYVEQWGILLATVFVIAGAMAFMLRMSGYWKRRSEAGKSLRRHLVISYLISASLFLPAFALLYFINPNPPYDFAQLSLLAISFSLIFGEVMLDARLLGRRGAKPGAVNCEAHDKGTESSRNGSDTEKE